jgi:GTP cyclohydrolase I
VAVKLNSHPDVTWYKIEAENFESIHNHNAYACIETGPAKTGPRRMARGG